MILFMFDIDGTLTESYEYDRQVFEQALRTIVGNQPIDSDWRNYKHVSSSGVSQEALQKATGRKATPEEVARVEEEVMNLLEKRQSLNPKEFREIKGASAFLGYLQKQQRCCISIATGCWYQEAMFKTKACGLHIDDYPLATSSDELERHKIMLLSEERARLKYGQKRFESVVFFGDGLWDLEASKKLGYQFIGIGKRTAQLKVKGVEYLFSDYSDLASFPIPRAGLVVDRRRVY